MSIAGHINPINRSLIVGSHLPCKQREAKKWCECTTYCQIRELLVFGAAKCTTSPPGKAGCTTRLVAFPLPNRKTFRNTD